MDEADIQIFTDRSGLDGGVGASAVLFRDGQEKKVLRYRLGKEENHGMVYEGECVGLILALHLLEQEREISTVSIWVDNTAAIMAAGSSRNGPAHYLLDLFHTQLLEIRDKHPNLMINVSWVPGHKGIYGNE
ncbi:hypothetical protein K435DRAFT_673757 [Dendrothele bispora CBS 962.96]|uniref:RNase H type-1 domain-containing protein n=1 Tax=Dendrothele bispora (strain CBS 962.96) TaxID=1314807 RepID=A0A4S8LQ85_DENBC|nr:hypothetical protein K435DRAFT_673757 [Dendrothele bispora CBS 962.96]